MTPADLRLGGIDESHHFNVLSVVRDKVSRQCPQTTTFEEAAKPPRAEDWGFERPRPFPRAYHRLTVVQHNDDDRFYYLYSAILRSRAD